jgi:[histone H3]-lysine36 N-dimethyltransferase SETMAR
MEAKSFRDDYEHVSESIEYILENILQEDDGTEEFKELEILFNSSIMNGCKCQFCGDECPHGGNYRLSEGELLLSEDRRCKDLIYECNESCHFSPCNNKLVQYGPRKNLIIKTFESKGLGLVSSSALSKGSFICEYAGEILTKTEAFRRDSMNQKEKKMNYVFCLNEIGSQDGARTQTFIDPSLKGNIGRYINHSCDANCDIISTRVDSIIPKIAIFANRDISAYTELTFNYGPHQDVQDDEQSKEKSKCHCNSFNCQKFLPSFYFT